ASTSVVSGTGSRSPSESRWLRSSAKGCDSTCVPGRHTSVPTMVTPSSCIFAARLASDSGEGDISGRGIGARLLAEPIDEATQCPLPPPRLPSQLEETGHAAARRGSRERMVEAVRLFEEALHGGQLCRVHRPLGERDRLRREGRDAVGESLDEGAELARREGA